MKTPHIAIIGGGLSGLTSAISLELLGYKTTVYTDKTVDAGRKEKPQDSRFASLYASGSMIPHTVKIASLNRILGVSASCFQSLAQAGVAGVRFQKHFEVFEKPESPPEYAKAVLNFTMLPKDGSGDLAAPRRTAAKDTYGWYFDCLFSESHSYLSFLYEVYSNLDGKIIVEKVRAEKLPEADLVVNCSGYWTKELFEDSSKLGVVRGHLLYVDSKGIPTNRVTGHPFSYNYRPSPEIYRTASGSAADVYFYPRTDLLILGGSRQAGDISPDGRWVGDETVGETAMRGDVSVPLPIVSLNRELIFSLSCLDISKFPQRAVIGYRFVREQGVRVELTNENGKPVVHNYGHGGAGLTLSWGCAAHVAELVSKALPNGLPDSRQLEGLPNGAVLQSIAAALRDSVTTPITTEGFWESVSNKTDFNVKKSSKKMRIMLLFCGGTISMTKNSKTGAAESHYGVEQLLALDPRISEKFDLQTDTVSDIDSTNATNTLWEELARRIEKHYDNVDGFIITMGTNTLAYCSSALSFALADIGKPVCITGAQIPAESAITDARNNFLNSLRIASQNISGVFVVFGTRVIKGCRAKKMRESALDAFESFNSADVASIGAGINFNEYISPRHSRPLVAKNAFNTNIFSITLIPGISPQLLSAAVEGGVEGIILRAFGSGDIPEYLFDFLAQAKKKRVPVVVTTQCPAGMTMLGMNDVGLRALEYNVIEAFDMSMEAMSTKLMWLLAQKVPYESIGQQIQQNLVGECDTKRDISIRTSLYL